MVSLAIHSLSYSGVAAVGALAEDFRHEGFESGVNPELFPVELALFPVELLVLLDHEQELVIRLIEFDYQRCEAAQEIIKGIVIHGAS
jgi:hypothetical protein